MPKYRFYLNGEDVTDRLRFQPLVPSGVSAIWDPQNPAHIRAALDTFGPWARNRLADDDCMCDPDVWGPDGMERGDGHNPRCPNHGKVRAAEEYRVERDARMLDATDPDWMEELL